MSTSSRTLPLVILAVVAVAAFGTWLAVSSQTYERTPEKEAAYLSYLQVMNPDALGGTWFGTTAEQAAVTYGYAACDNRAGESTATRAVQESQRTLGATVMTEDGALPVAHAAVRFLCPDVSVDWRR